MLHKRSEKGQAIILIVFSIIGIIGLTALTVDGGIAYSDRRSAQGAADSAAWAGGLANARGGDTADIQTAAGEIADQNGYTGDGTRSVVTVDVLPLVADPLDPTKLVDGSDNPCPEYASPNVEITVDIVSNVNTFFAPVIGVEQITNHVTAVTRACGTYQAAIFGGQAVVSCGNNLGPTDCAFDTGNSGNPEWTIHGSGIHSDTCIHTKETDSVDLDTGQCAEGVTLPQGEAGAIACSNPGARLCTPEYLTSVMPDNPCDGDGVGDIGVPLPGIPATGPHDPPYTLDGGTGDGTVFCVNTSTQLTDLKQADVILKNATIYINMDSFDFKYAGKGSLSGTPSASGDFSSLAVVAKPNTNDPCVSASGPQSMDYRGNAGSPPLYGTILAPTACVTLRGNAGDSPGCANSDGCVIVNSQIVANMVNSNGTPAITVNYIEDQNYRPPEEPTIILVR